MVPHMGRYGVRMHRFPDGPGGDDLHHRDTPDWLPDWIRTVTVPGRDGRSYDAPIADGRAAPVSMPLDRREIEQGADPQDWPIENALGRPAHRDDPWSGMMRHARSVGSRREALDDLLQAEEPADEERDRGQERARTCAWGSGCAEARQRTARRVILPARRLPPPSEGPGRPVFSCQGTPQHGLCFVRGRRVPPCT